MFEYVRVEVKAAEDEYGFSPEKGVAGYMRALGRLREFKKSTK